MPFLPGLLERPPPNLAFSEHPRRVQLSRMSELFQERSVEDIILPTNMTMDHGTHVTCLSAVYRDQHSAQFLRIIPFSVVIVCFRCAID